MNISCRVIRDTTTIKHPYHKYVYGNIKYIPSKLHSPINIWIYGDTSLLVLFGTKPLITIKIKSKIMAEGLKDYFEQLWSMPIDFKDRITYRTRLFSLIRETKNLDILCKSEIVPFFLYPHDKAGFLKYRKLIKKKRKTLTGSQDVLILKEYLKLWKGGSKIKYVAEEKSLASFFGMIKKYYGRNELLRRLADIRKNIKRYKVEIRILSQFYPMVMYISERELMVVISYSGEVYGFVTSEPEIRHIFMQIYEEFWKRAYPIDKYLSKFENSSIS